VRLVVYRGPSRLDGGPIVAVLTDGSHNRKTGPMVQAWVLRADLTPRLALARRLDRSICGDCVHRSDGDGITSRSCYVRTQLGPTTIWQSIAAGDYEQPALEEAAQRLAGAQLRLCAYGDPVAVPFEIWRTLLLHVAGFTAYTHQFRTCDQRFRLFTMASVESDGERELAAFDFIVLLRKVFWADARVTDWQRRALLDHELCHGALKLDVNGEPIEDERGRKVFRTRKHDVEEFSAIVERYGLWTGDLERMAKSFQRQAQRDPFAPCVQCADSPGWAPLSRGDGTTAVVRCACWTAWNERRIGWSEPAA